MNAGLRGHCGCLLNLNRQACYERRTGHEGTCECACHAGETPAALTSKTESRPRPAPDISYNEYLERLARWAGIEWRRDSMHVTAENAIRKAAEHKEEIERLTTVFAEACSEVRLSHNTPCFCKYCYETKVLQAANEIGRLPSETPAPHPNDDVRWVCPHCSTVNGLDAAECVGCRRIRFRQACTCTETCARHGAPFPAGWSWQCKGLRFAPRESSEKTSADMAAT